MDLDISVLIRIIQLVTKAEDESYEISDSDYKLLSSIRDHDLSSLLNAKIQPYEASHPEMASSILS